MDVDDESEFEDAQEYPSDEEVQTRPAPITSTRAHTQTHTHTRNPLAAPAGPSSGDRRSEPRQAGTTRNTAQRPLASPVEDEFEDATDDEASVDEPGVRTHTRSEGFSQDETRLHPGTRSYWERVFEEDDGYNDVDDVDDRDELQTPEKHMIKALGGRGTDTHTHTRTPTGGGAAGGVGLDTTHASAVDVDAISGWSDADRAILSDFARLRELQTALFSKHLALETTFRKIEPEHDFDKRTFCEHFPEAFREKEDEAAGIIDALDEIAEAMAAMTAKLQPPQDALDPDLEDTVFDIELPADADLDDFDAMDGPADSAPPSATAPRYGPAGAAASAPPDAFAASTPVHRTAASSFSPNIVASATKSEMASAATPRGAPAPKVAVTMASTADFFPDRARTGRAGASPSGAPTPPPSKSSSGTQRFFSPEGASTTTPRSRAAGAGGSQEPRAASRSTLQSSSSFVEHPATRTPTQHVSSTSVTPGTVQAVRGAPARGDSSMAPRLPQRR